MMSDSLIFIPVGANGSAQYLGVEATAIRKGVYEIDDEPGEDIRTPYHKGDHVRCEIWPIETPNGEELMQVVTGRVDPA